MSLDNVRPSQNVMPIPCERSTDLFQISSYLSGTDRTGQKWSERETKLAVAMNESGLSVVEIASRLGRTKGSVCGALRRAELAGIRDRFANKFEWTDKRQKELRFLWSKPITLGQIAAHFDVSVENVRSAGKRFNLGPRNGVRRRYRDGRIHVPAWVPQVLHEEYVAVAEEDGEFAAASWARAEKRAMPA